MKLSEILKEKKSGVITISGTSSVGEAVEMLNGRKIGALIVDNGKGEVTGILTERDILSKAYPCSKESMSIKVASLMTPRDELIIGLADDTVSYAMNIMTEKRIRHIPVFDKDRLAGIISIGDLIKAVMDQSETEVRLLREYITNPYGINFP